MKILLIEKEHKLASTIEQGLSQQSYLVDVIYDSERVLELIDSDQYSLIILDQALIDTSSGVDILQKMREQKIHTPVLLLATKDKLLDGLRAISSEADDFLVKPFAFVELLARVRALLKRPGGTGENKLAYRDMVLDLDNYFSERQGQRIDLTSKEFALLEYLMRNQGKVMSKDAIMRHVWSYDARILPNTVEVYIGYLRNKIDKPFKTSYINTRRGFGYYFGVPQE